MNNLHLIVLTSILAMMLSLGACKKPSADLTAAAEEETAARTTEPSEEKPVDLPGDKLEDFRKPPEDVAGAPEDAQKTDSGLASKMLKKGTGIENPGPSDMVTVHYTGWTTDGKMFDSSHLRHKPSTFPLNKVIPGWTEGLQLMVKDEKRRFWIPVELAYNGAPGKPPGMLVFDVELLDIQKAPEAPPDVAKPPKKAEKTESGLAFRILEKGEGTEHPGPTSLVTVNYSGWTTDGNMFDSSIVRGKPATFPLNKVIPGWTEGLQLMVKGEKRRFWIPVELAYNGAPGKPPGMLVFDVELIDFQ